MDMTPRDRSANARSQPSTDEWVDPVIEAYKKDVDRTLIRAALARTVEDRLLSLQYCVEDVMELRRAAAVAARAKP